MENVDHEYAVLLVNGEATDITDCVTQVKAMQGGELKYRGNGIEVKRFLHYRGNAVIFLSLKQANMRLFGHDCKVYTLAENWLGHYYDYDMVAECNHQVVSHINGADPVMISGL